MANVGLKTTIWKMPIRNPVWDAEEAPEGHTEHTLPKVDGSGFCECSLHLVGMYSREFIEASRQALRARGDNWDIVNLDEENTKILAACVVGWDDTGFIDVSYSPEEAMDLLQNVKWLADQVQLAIADKKRFFANGSTN